MRLFNFLPLLTLSLGLRTAIGQTVRLTGSIRGSDGDSIEWNRPIDGNYWKKTSLYIRPDGKGNFQALIPCMTNEFVLLLYKGHRHLLLLSAGSRLHVYMDVNDPAQRLRFSGKARVENEWIQRLNLAEAGKSARAGGNELAGIRHGLDSAERLLSPVKMDPSVKRAILSELNFSRGASVLDDLNNGRLASRTTKYEGQSVDTIVSIFGLPDKQELDMGIAANNYLDAYFKLRFNQALSLYRSNPDKEQADLVFRDNTGISLKYLQDNPDHDEKYIFFTSMTRILPGYAQEKHLANLLIEFCMEGQLVEADKLLQFIKINYPESAYLDLCERTFAPLKSKREQYAKNLDIRIRPDYRNIHSIRELLDPYKGKVVFLDIWGTWCPHCIEDLASEPALKSRLKGRDIVYLYVAEEDDANDEKWKDFILINDMTGEHVRRTMDEMAILWNELGIRDSEQAYPDYLIVDRSGAIVDRNAKRPSDGDALYMQLNAVIDSGR